LKTKQLGPRGHRRCGLPDSGETGGALGRGSGGTRPGSHLGLAGDRSWGGGGSDERARWRTMAAAAVRCDSGEGEAKLGNARRFELLWGPRESLGWLGSSGSECGASLPSAPSMVPTGGSGGGGVACTREEQAVAFYKWRSQRFETIKKDEGGPTGASGCRRRGWGPGATHGSTPQANARTPRLSRGRVLPRGRSPGEARVG
jgi:hypothetical protein